MGPDLGSSLSNTKVKREKGVVCGNSLNLHTSLPGTRDTRRMDLGHFTVPQSLHILSISLLELLSGSMN